MNVGITTWVFINEGVSLKNKKGDVPMKKTVKKLTAVILAIMIALTCSMPAFAGLEGNYIKTTAGAVQSMYDSGKKFILFVCRDGCVNCKNIRNDVVYEWTDYYGYPVYVVEIEYINDMPEFLYNYMGRPQSGDTPVVAFVDGNSIDYYEGATSYDILNAKFYEFSGIALATGLSLSATSMNLKVGGWQNLEAILVPSNAMDTISCKSSNESVASVSYLYGGTYTSTFRITANAAGTATLTVKTYKSKLSATCTITVTDNGSVTPVVTLSSISIRTNPSKTTYTVGESFNSSGLSLTAKYSDGSTKTITSGFACSKPDMSTAGTKTVTVTYQGKTASFNITVKAKAPAVTVSSIEIRTNPSKMTYNVGESFNSSGLSLNVYYSDGTSKSVTSGFTCSKPDMSTAGTKKVTVTYKGKTASFNITVKAKPATVTLSSISVKTYPSKTTYNVGESFSSSGLTLNAKYSDGSTKTITSGFTCSKPDISTAGIKSVTVTYQGKTTSFNITVKSNVVKATSVEIIVEKDFNGTSVAELGAQVNPSNASYKSLVWSSADPRIATVDADGTVTTVSSGITIVTVTVTNHDGSTVSDTIEVEVVDNSSSGGGIFDFIIAIFELLFLPFTLLFSILF